MKTSPLDEAMSAVQEAARRGEHIRLCVASVSEREDPEWVELLAEFWAAAAVLESRWGAPTTRGARPTWFAGAEATCSWEHFGARAFVAMHREDGVLRVTLGTVV